MSNHRLFEFYSSILNVILNHYKLKRVNMLQRDFHSELSYARAEPEEAKLMELSAASKVPIILPEI